MDTTALLSAAADTTIPPTAADNTIPPSVTDTSPPADTISPTAETITPTAHNITSTADTTTAADNINPAADTITATADTTIPSSSAADTITPAADTTTTAADTITLTADISPDNITPASDNITATADTTIPRAADSITSTVDKITPAADTTTTADKITPAADTSTSTVDNITRAADKITHAADKITHAADNITHAADNITHAADTSPPPYPILPSPTQAPPPYTTIPLSSAADKLLLDGDVQHYNATEETCTITTVELCSIDHQVPEENEGGCTSCLRPCLRRHHPLISNPSWPQRLKYSFLCPPHGTVGEWLTVFLLLCLVYGSLVSLLGDAALPGGNIFSLFITFLAAEAAGRMVVPLKLPPLLGMLVVGILLKSVPGVDQVGANIDQEWSATLRNLALVIILLRAGLGLDPAALKQLSLMVVRLAFCPCVVETLVVAVVTHFLLGFPWLWGLMLGFVLGAVTPAVIVPCMLVLSQKGYGVAKGIPTLVIAASSVDDVLAISGFGVLMGITFAEGELWVVILKGPFEVVVGLAYGIVLGVLCWVLPVPSDPKAPVLRFVVLLSAGVLALFGSPLIYLGGSGALGCLVMAFVAGYGWRKQGMTEENYVDQMLEYMWMFFQPFLFALIGAEIQVDKLDGSTVGYGLLTLVIGLVFRMVTSFVVVMGGQLNLKERLFVAFAWLPKATVQAAIGSQALDYARKTNAGPEEERLGEQVLTIAVLSILLTAPVGAAAIMLTAPRLLGKSGQGKNEEDEGMKEAQE